MYSKLFIIAIAVFCTTQIHAKTKIKVRFEFFGAAMYKAIATKVNFEEIKKQIIQEKHNAKKENEEVIIEPIDHFTFYEDGKWKKIYDNETGTYEAGFNDFRSYTAWSEMFGFNINFQAKYNMWLIGFEIGVTYSKASPHLEFSYQRTTVLNNIQNLAEKVSTALSGKKHHQKGVHHYFINSSQEIVNCMSWFAGFNGGRYFNNKVNWSFGLGLYGTINNIVQIKEVKNQEFTESDVNNSIPIKNPLGLMFTCRLGFHLDCKTELFIRCSFIGFFFNYQDFNIVSKMAQTALPKSAKKKQTETDQHIAILTNQIESKMSWTAFITLGLSFVVN